MSLRAGAPRGRRPSFISARTPPVKIHEYQAKEILRKYGVAVPRGYVAVTPFESEGAARQLGGGIVAVKAQIHAGGRGKGGGVRLARSPEEARSHAEAMLGMKLKTPQTAPAGQLVRKVYIEEGCRIARELYLGMTLDRESGQVTVMASSEGGQDIDRKSTRLNSSHVAISYAVFCLK